MPGAPIQLTAIDQRVFDCAQVATPDDQPCILASLYDSQLGKSSHDRVARTKLSLTQAAELHARLGAMIVDIIKSSGENHRRRALESQSRKPPEHLITSPTPNSHRRSPKSTPQQRASLGSEIRRRRQALGMTLMQLGAAINRSWSGICQVERGSVLSPSLAKALSGLLKWPELPAIAAGELPMEGLDKAPARRAASGPPATHSC
jgi:hypothetical protein